jgi:hypothetical protein
VGKKPAGWRDDFWRFGKKYQYKPLVEKSRGKGFSGKEIRVQEQSLFH